MAQREAPDGVFSFLDTDLYKLSMQCAVLKYFSKIEVVYAFTNRTPDMKLSKEAFSWLQQQIEKLAKITLSKEELDFLQHKCPYLSSEYLVYLENFRMRPSEHVQLSFDPSGDTGYGDLSIKVKGLWLETILYEIPLLALTSEAYFKFVDQDWNHDGQEEAAYQKGIKLFKAGCLVSEFGSRRRRDLKTQDLVVGGLKRASEVGGMPGKLTGTSNVYLARKHGLSPVGTVAHEWYMGIAALTDNYEQANELGLSYWLDCFGEGVLGIALTDTFGTPAFFKAFARPVVPIPSASPSFKTSLPSSVSPSVGQATSSSRSYAQIFGGIRQDSGDPKDYIKLAREFYDSVAIKDSKTIVFSDALNTEKCIAYKFLAEKNGFVPSFGVGTFFTNDFKSRNGEKSLPLNIVIKLSSCGGRPAIKISDNIGKNTGDPQTVQDVKRRLGYEERGWKDGDEGHRWDQK
jgi:nicotinate phosphoribosyltransferase